MNGGLITFTSGLTLNIKASSTNYSQPIESNGPYTSVEIYGNHKFLTPNAPDNIHAYVPIKTLFRIIRKEGGIKEGQLPFLDFKGIVL